VPDLGLPEVVDAGLADYFGSIPHADLLKSAARRIVDRRVLHLIKMWLECAVEETGRPERTAPGTAPLFHRLVRLRAAAAPLRTGSQGSHVRKMYGTL